MSSWYQVQRARLTTEWGLVVFMEGGGPGQNCSPGCSGMRLTGWDNLSGGNRGNPHWAGCKGFPAVKTDSQTKIMLHSVCVSVSLPHKPLLNQIISVCTTFRDAILGCKVSFCKAVFVEIQICIRSPDTTCTEPDKPWNLLSLTPVPR